MRKARSPRRHLNHTSYGKQTSGETQGEESKIWPFGCLPPPLFYKNHEDCMLDITCVAAIRSHTTDGYCCSSVTSSPPCFLPCRQQQNARRKME